MAVYAVLAAAGSSSRMGGVNKQLIPLKGIPVLVRTMQTFQQVDSIDGIVVVGRKEDIEVYKQCAVEYKITKCIDVVEGGMDRQASVFAALKAIRSFSQGDDLVLIHDGARCLVDEELIHRVIGSLEQYDAVTAAVKVIDTIAKGTEDMDIEQVVDRDFYWQIQTPQGFRFKDIYRWHEAVEKDGIRYTDDSSVALASGAKVGLIEGSRQNIKITTEEDLEIGAVFLSRI